MISLNVDQGRYRSLESDLNTYFQRLSYTGEYRQDTLDKIQELTKYASMIRDSILNHREYNEFPVKRSDDMKLKIELATYFAFKKAANIVNKTTGRNSSNEIINSIHNDLIYYSIDSSENYANRISHDFVNFLRNHYNRESPDTDKFLSDLYTASQVVIEERKRKFPGHPLVKIIEKYDINLIQKQKGKLNYNKEIIVSEISNTNKRLHGLSEKQIIRLEWEKNQLLNELNKDPESLIISPTTSINDIVGYEEQKRELVLRFYPLKYKDTFLDLGLKEEDISYSALIAGFSGTGKTKLAHGIANEFNLDLLSINFDDLMSKYVGESEKIIKYLFSYVLLREHDTLLFIDEFDGYAADKSKDNIDKTRHLNTILTLLSEGSIYHSRIPFIGATSRPDFLGDDILRRMKSRIFLEMPDSGQREAIVKHYIEYFNANAKKRKGNAPFVADLDDIKKISENTINKSGSDLRDIIVSSIYQKAAEIIENDSDDYTIRLK